MSENNPYATPNAQVNDIQSDGFGTIKVLTPEGRMGRLRYFYHGLLIGISGLVLIALAALLTSLGSAFAVIGGILIFVIYIAMFVFSIFITIQRCHDFNTSGWMSLLLLVPLAPLVFYFIPGTKGTNQYGLMPPPNTKRVIWGSILIPLLFIVLFGILGAIAIPALEKYKASAEGAQSSLEEQADDATKALEKLQEGTN